MGASVEWLATARRTVATRFAVDTRALAVFRIALASVLLIDLVRRATDLVAFYTDRGAMPRATLRVVEPGYQYVSIHALSGAAWVQWLLFAVAALAAIALLLGYRTRIAVLVSLILLVGIQARNPAVLNSGDTLFRRLLFWSLFLPLGERWAIDATSEDWRPSVVGPATVGLLGQVVAVYATNAVVKLRADIWLRGDAIRYAFQLDHFTIFLGDYFAGMGTLLTLVGWAWIALLVCSPFLVVLTGYWRTGLVAAFASVHFGMVLMLSLGIFPLVSMAALIPFVPSVVWDRLQSACSPYFSPVVERLPRRESAGPSLPAFRSIGRAVAIVAVAGIIVVNAISLGVVAAPAGTPDAVEDRSWDMFAPSPPRATWWYAIPATLESGKQVDALSREPVELSRPPDVASAYPNERWRKLLDKSRQHPELQQSLADYLCWRWNRAHSDEMVSLRLIHFSEPTNLNGPETVERQTIGEYTCSDAA